MSWLFKLDGKSIGTLAPILPMNIQGWFKIDGLISLQSKGLSRVFSTTVQSINSSGFNLLYGPTLTSIHDCWKKYSFDYKDLCQQSDVSAL